MISVSASVSSNSSLSFEARGLAFCRKTPHVNALKFTNEIYEILSRSWDMRVFWRKLAQASKRMLGHLHRSLYAKFQPSCYKTEKGDRGEGHVFSNAQKIQILWELVKLRTRRITNLSNKQTTNSSNYKLVELQTHRTLTIPYQT